MARRTVEQVSRCELAVAASGQVLRSLAAVRRARRLGVAPGSPPPTWSST